MRPHDLPVSVRLALWVTASWASPSGSIGLDEAVGRAHPDIDSIQVPAGRLELWRDLGEGALLVALPGPGDVSALPACSGDALAAATDAEECCFVAGTGGLLVPQVAPFGPAGDIGWSVVWEGYDASPVPRHRLEMLDAGQLERDLLAAVAAASEDIAAAGGQPWLEDPRSLLESRLAEAAWGLPPMPERAGRAARTLRLAGRVGAIVRHALQLEASAPALTASVSGTREASLRRLQRAADDALAGASNVAVMHLASWR